MKKTENQIRYLFEPRSVAVLGATRDPQKIGHKILANIVSGGYRGKVFPINPQGGEILGLKAYTSIEEVNHPIDLATIVIPAHFVYEAVQSCARKKVKFLSIISSGFSEVGNFEEERKIVSFARQQGMRVLGPNIFGIYSATASLNATFGSSSILPGKVAIITQSGALGIAMIGKTAVENIGLSAIISVGNKADLNEADLLEYLVTDGRTKVILLYMEGIRGGEDFVQALEKVTKKIPVVVIKSGRSERGAIAAASHTGSLAGSDEVFDALMHQFGVMRAESVAEAFHWCKFLAQAPIPKGENTVIITNGGGIGVLATDACEKYRVRLYDDLPVLKDIFGQVTPNFGSTKNPIDLTGQATSLHYRLALQAARDNPQIHSVIALYGETAVFDAENLLALIREIDQEFKAGQKPLLFSIFGGEIIEKCLDQLRKEEVAVFGDVYETVSCLGALYTYHNYLQNYSAEKEEIKINFSAIEGILDKVLEEKRDFLLAPEGQKILQAAQIAFPRSVNARNIEEAMRAAEEIGYPVVMKVISRDILHKSDAGGVALDLQNKEEVLDAYQAIMRSCRTFLPRARIEGVEVSEMVEKGTETIIGARRDNTFGPLVMFGLGGIYVEVMKDVTFRALPINQKQARGMIKEIQAYPLLMGVRGENKKDMDEIVATILKVAAILEKFPMISDIEINPFVVYEQGKGGKAVDLRIMLNKEKRGHK